MGYFDNQKTLQMPSAHLWLKISRARQSQEDVFRRPENAEGSAIQQNYQAVRQDENCSCG